MEAHAAVLASDPRAARELIAGIVNEAEIPDLDAWRARAAATRNAPPFVVLRLWLDHLVDACRPAFLGTSGYGPLDNISVLERFEEGARSWSWAHGGSVVELHAYAADAPDEEAAQRVASRLIDELHRAFPETTAAGIVHRELLVRDDCTLITPDRWSDRPAVTTPHPGVALAGDWVRTDYPVALMERAATTGFLAANQLLEGWGARGHDLWTVPLRGLLAPRERGRLHPSSH